MVTDKERRIERNKITSKLILIERNMKYKNMQNWRVTGFERGIE
jgi:hypothetical protein